MDADQFIRCENIPSHSLPSFAKPHSSSTTHGTQSPSSNLTSTYSSNNGSGSNAYRLTLSAKLKQFYFEEFHLITKSFKRGRIYSLFVFNLYWLQQVSLLFNARVQSLISSSASQNIPSQIYSILSYIRIEPLIGELLQLSYLHGNPRLSKYIVLISLLVSMLLFLFYVCLRLLIFVVSAKQSTAEALVYRLHKQREAESDSFFRSKQAGAAGSSSSSGNSSHSLKGASSSALIQALDTIASCYFQSFPFVFFVPAAQIFSEIYNDQLTSYGSTLASISIVTFGIYLIAYVVYIIHDYDYEIAYTDFLSKRDSLWGYFHILVSTIMATFYNTEWGLGISMFHWVTKLAQMIELFMDSPFHDKLIRRCNLLQVFSHFAFAFIAYLVIVLDLSQRTIVSLLYMVIIPLALQLGDYIFLRMEARVRNVYKNSNEPSRIDRYVRYLNSLYAMEYTTYTRLEFGVTFESIYVDHIEKCIDTTCFCNEFQTRPFKWENLIQSDDRSYFLENIIVSLLESLRTTTANVTSNTSSLASVVSAASHTKKRGTDNRLRFTYLQFLIEKVSNPTKPFTQIINSLNNKDIFSLKEKYILHLIMRRCLVAHSSYFNNSQFQNQRLPMMAVISFDQILENSLNQFKEILYEVRAFYNFLCADYIDLQLIYTNGQFLLKRRRQLEINVKLLFDINPKSDILFNLAEGYTQFLELKNRRIKYLKRRSLDLLHRNRIKTDLEINLTAKNSCIAYISLLTSSGTVKHLTHSFEQIFGLPIKNTIGKSISTLMADIFCREFHFIYSLLSFLTYSYVCLLKLICKRLIPLEEDHDTHLQRFVNKGPQILFEKERVMLFGKNSLGFIFPIALRLRLNYIGNEDFGVCGHMVKQTDCTSEFITLDSGMNLSDISRRLFNSTFALAFNRDISQIRKVHLSRILPVLGSLVEVNYLNRDKVIESTLMVIPQRLKQISFFKRKSQHRKDNMGKYVAELLPNRFLYFNVSVTFSTRISPGGSRYRVCEFKSVTLMKKVSQQRQSIKEFLQQYNFNFCANLVCPSAFGDATSDTDASNEDQLHTNSQPYEQSQMIYSSNSFSDELVQSKRKPSSHRKQHYSNTHAPIGGSSRQNDFLNMLRLKQQFQSSGLATQDNNGRNDSSERTSFPMLTSVYSLVRKFIRNMNAAIGKKDNKRMNSLRMLNKLRTGSESNDIMSQNHKYSQSELPTDLVYSSTNKSNNNNKNNNNKKRRLSSQQIPQLQPSSQQQQQQEKSSQQQQNKFTKQQTLQHQGFSTTSINSHTAVAGSSQINSGRVGNGVNSGTANGFGSLNMITTPATRREKNNQLLDAKNLKSARKRVNSVESGSEIGATPGAAGTNANGNNIGDMEVSSQAGGIRFFQDFKSAQHLHLAIIEDGQQFNYAPISSPTMSDNQINLFSQRALISEFSGRFDFSGRPDFTTTEANQINPENFVGSYENHREKSQTMTIEKPFINISVQKNHNISNFTSSIMHLEDTNCMLSPKQRTELSYMNRKEENSTTENTRMNNNQQFNHQKSLLQSQQQKFYDSISLNELQHQRSGSLIETISPSRLNKLHSLKRKTTNTLRLQKDSSYSNTMIQSTDKKSGGQAIPTSGSRGNRRGGGGAGAGTNGAGPQNSGGRSIGRKRRHITIAENEANDDDNDEDDELTSRKKRNTETIFENDVNNRGRQEKLNDQQSVNSALSQTYAKKIQVIDGICSKKKSILITTIQLSGLAAFLFMVTVSLGIFIYLNTIFQDNVRDFSNLLVGPQLQSNYANLLKEQEILHLESLNFNFFSQQSESSIKSIQTHILTTFLTALESLFYERETVSFSVHVNSQKIEVDDLLLPNESDMLLYEESSKQHSFLINYACGILYSHLNNYVKREDSSANSVRFIEKNIVVFFEEFANLSKMAQDQSFYEVRNMEDNIILTIAIMEAVAIIVLALGLPIYSKIMAAKETWLALFSTWPQVISFNIILHIPIINQLFLSFLLLCFHSSLQSKLHEMINKIEKYISMEYGGLKPLGRGNAGKRKAISSTTSLNKCSSLLTLSLFACIVLVSIYPMMNLIFAQDFVREFNFSIGEIATIYETRASIDSEFALTLLSVRLLANDQYLSYDLTAYLADLHEQNRQHILSLYEISEHFTVSRFQDNNYNEFLIPSLNTNACSALFANTQYFTSGSLINQKTCQTALNGILTKGIIATLKVLETKFNEMQEFIAIANNDFKTDFSQWANETDLNGMVEMHRQLSDAFDSLRFFLITMTEDYNASITNTQFWLLFYSLTVLVTIFVIGFNLFVLALANYLYKTRVLMTLFKVDDILENSYIMRFLSDHRLNLSNT